MGIPGETGEKPGSVTTSPYPLLPQGTSGVYPQTVTPRISSCQNQVSCNNQQWFQITLQHVQDLQLALCPQPCAPELEGILCLLPLSGEGGQEEPGSPRGRRPLLLPTTHAASSGVLGQSPQVLIKIYWTHEISKK